MSLHYVVK